MNIFSRTKLMFCAILLAVSVQSPHAQEVPFEPTDNKHLASCLARVAQITNLSQIQRRDCIGVAFHLCTQEPDGDTTLGTTRCYQREGNWWDAQLNTDYTDLKNTFSTELFQTLRQAQVAWIAYRDAKCEFAYKLYEDGSIRHILFSNCIMRTTADRSIELKQIL